MFHFSHPSICWCLPWSGQLAVDFDLGVLDARNRRAGVCSARGITVSCELSETTGTKHGDRTGTSSPYCGRTQWKSGRSIYELTDTSSGLITWPRRRRPRDRLNTFSIPLALTRWALGIAPACQRQIVGYHVREANRDNRALRTIQSLDRREMR